jgi:hypothetical protein
MSTKNKRNTNVFENFRRQIMAVATRNGSVSSVDLTRVQSRVTGPSRGALMRNAFASLVADGVLVVADGDGVYNGKHRHRVSVYNPVKVVRKKRS